MNAFRIWALQDLSCVLPVKSLQHETHVSTNVFKHCLSNLLNSSRKQKNIFTTWMASPEITSIFNFRSHIYFLPFKTNVEIIRLENLKSLTKRNELLDENSAARSKCYKTFPSNYYYNKIQKYNNKNTKITPKIIFTLQESQQRKIDRTIEQSTDLSSCVTAKNVDSPSPTKPELETLEIQQQQSQDLFETSQQLNTIIETQGCAKNAAKLQSAFSKIEIPRNIPLEWSTMERSYPRREYHICQPFKIENDAITCDDYHFFASDIGTIQEQSAGCGSSRFNHLIYPGNSGNQGSRKSSCPSVPPRVVLSKSCTVIQQSIREIHNLRKDLSANVPFVRLKSTRSYPDRVSLAKPRSFSCDASKGSADCEENGRSQPSKCKDEAEDYQEVARSRCQIKNKKICGKVQRKDTCVSSRDDVCQKRRQRKSECESYTCPELKKKMPCSWDVERCPEPGADRKCDAKGRASSRGRARRSRDSNCSQEQEWQSKSYKRCEDYEKSDEPRAICRDSTKERNDCESKREKGAIGKKERRKCSGNSRKRSNSCRRRNSSRTGDKSCSKADGKRRYSQQSISFVPQDRKSFSTLIPDVALGTNARKTTQRSYASCGRDEKERKYDPCKKRKRKCELKEKDEIKKKCVKGPAKCMSRKKTTNKVQTCQSAQRDEQNKSCESTKKSNREEFCINRKKEFTKDEKFKVESPTMKAPTIKDKKPKEPSIKEHIDREYKEIDECKKNFKKEKKDNKAKMISTKHKSMGLNCIINSYKEQQRENSEKFINTFSESIIPTDTIFKWLNIQSEIINGKIPILAKDVRLFNPMFDRSFSTAKLDCQDDFAIERTMNDDKVARNYSADSDDFIYGDELPNNVEIEYEDEEDDVYDVYH